MKPEELNQLKKDHPILGVYFKTNECGVCSALLPRVVDIFTNYKVALEIINLKTFPDLVGTEMVMNVPVLKVFHYQREVFKEGAFLNFDRLEKLIENLRSMDG